MTLTTLAKRIEDEVIAGLPANLARLLLVALLALSLLGCGLARPDGADARDRFERVERWSGGSAE